MDSQLPWQLEWDADCLRWWGRLLEGRYRHWCPNWGDLPIDDTCEEMASCTCERRGSERWVNELDVR